MVDKTGFKGRAALNNAASRYDDWQREDYTDDWYSETNSNLKTTLIPDNSQSIITRNQSPDVPFEQSINPYRGCEHGCIYCYARPSHAWLGYSPGLDFESKIIYKPHAAALLKKAFEKKSYQCKVIALGSNTDAYQPVERKLGLSRQILQTLLDYRHPVGIITKSSLIERDVDLLGELASRQLVNVLISITTLDAKLAQTMEPRAASPTRRLKIIENLRQHNINVGVLVAPVVPVLTDAEMENILQAAHEAGAQFAGKVLLRLPMETADLFEQWLIENTPTQARRVMARLKECHSGHTYKSQFGERMTGTGQYAQLLSKRFALAVRKIGFSHEVPKLNTTLFSLPNKNSQLSLFPE